MTAIVFGAGFIGRRLAEALPRAHLSSVDITDAPAIDGELRARSCTVAINAAGKTGRPNVDWCEVHPHETYRSNAVGPLILAERCARAGVYLLHLGSGCVFHGPSPRPGGWGEEDAAAPISFYARTKLAADLVLSRLPGVGIVRIRMPIDGTPGPRNLITKLASYPAVIDVENSATVLDDLIPVVRALIEQRATGIFHATNPGVLRHRDLLQLYRAIVDSSHACELIPESELVARGLVAVARSNCLLASSRLAERGITMRPIGEALLDAMRQYARRRRGDDQRSP